MTDVKLCRDCKHSHPSSYIMTCTHPDIPPRDLATGAAEFAFAARSYGDCGRAATLFESRVPTAAEFPELEPLPGVRVSRWARMMARLYRWVHS